MVEPRSEQELEPLVRCRRAIEAIHHKGRRAHGRGDWLLRHDRLLGPLLRAALTLCGVYQRGARNALDLQCPLVRLEFADLPPAFHGFRILHLSDLHIDGVDGLAEVLAALVARTQADLYLLTGDYRYEVYGPCEPVYRRMETVLSALAPGSPVYGILGNHDSSEMVRVFERMGVRMLMNEAVEIRRGDSSLWLAGVDDPHYFGCDDLAQALAAAPAGSFKILLAHSPEVYEEAAHAGVHLYLGGHTHGGQISLPLLGPPLVNAACPRAYTHGRWRHRGMQGYTSPGAGCSMLPVRYNCPPEVPLLELVCA